MTAISELFSPATAANSTPEYKGASSDADIMGKEDFLNLLVAQLQNQDPLNPDDATEFTSQLTEFSSLEQLTNLNSSMSKLMDSQIEASRFDTMGLIGKDIIYSDNSFSFTGEPVTVGYQLDGEADSVSIFIQDENGADIRTLHPTELTKGEHLLQWNGLDNNGTEVPEGDYKIIVKASSSGDDLSVAISPLVQSEVSGVNFSTDSNNPVIQTLAGAEVASTSIISVFQSQQESTNGEE